MVMRLRGGRVPTRRTGARVGRSLCARLAGAVSGRRSCQPGWISDGSLNT